MRNLIKADIDRILRRKIIWIILVIMFIILAYNSVGKIDEAPDIDLAFTVSICHGISYVGLLIGIMLVLNIYGDDFKSMTFIRAIGRGISRPKLILARLLDTLLILINIYIVGGIYTFILNLALGVHLSSEMATYIFLQYASIVMCTTCSVVIAAAAFYLTENATLGIIAYLSADLLIPLALEFVKLFPNVSKYHLERYYFTGLSSSMVTDFMIGATGDGILKAVCIIAVYILGATAATILLFNRKELDF